MWEYLRRVFRFLRNRRYAYHPLIEVRISREAILRNLGEFKNLRRDISVAPVLKSNAYGHGLLQVASILKKENVPFICVDSYFEALQLRNYGLSIPLLIIGYTPLRNILANKLKNVSFAVIGLQELHALSQNGGKQVRVHLKVDTGMHRHGVLPDELEKCYMLIRANKHIACEGIFTHLADADTVGSAHASAQIRQWNDIVRTAKRYLPSARYFHCAATAGSLFSDIEANVMRLGIGLYGVNSGFARVDLHPALEMRTVISSVKTIQAGESVGYNATFTAKCEMKIATVPTGYNEGIDRRLSNKGFFLIRGIPCPIIGRVSMNITTIDVSHIPETKPGDEVILISADKTAPNSIENIAIICGAIPYEIMVHIPAHLRRVIV